MLPNDVILIIHAIEKLETYFVIAKNEAISSVANTVQKLHIQSDLHLIYKQNFYHDKQNEIYNLFIEYHVPLFDDLDHPSLIKEWGGNIDAAAYKKILNKVIKIPSKKKEIDRHDIIDYCPTTIKEDLNWLSILNIVKYT